MWTGLSWVILKQGVQRALCFLACTGGTETSEAVSVVRTDADTWRWHILLLVLEAQSLHVKTWTGFVHVVGPYLHKKMDGGHRIFPNRTEVEGGHRSAE